MHKNKELRRKWKNDTFFLRVPTQFPMLLNSAVSHGSPVINLNNLTQSKWIRANVSLSTFDKQTHAVKM